MVKMDSPGRRDYDHQEEKRRRQAGPGRQVAARVKAGRRKNQLLEPAPLRRRTNQQVDRRDRQSEAHLRAAHGSPLQYRGDRSYAEAASGAARSDRRDTYADPKGSRTHARSE